MLATEINHIIDNYMNAFNASDLGRVMEFFSEDAIYEPGDGKRHEGKAEISAAFFPQFHGALGSMRFDEDERLIDAPNRKVAIRWVCRHDLAKFQPHGLLNRLQIFVVGLTVGKRFGWRGVDVMHLDENGKINEKYTFACYGSRPHLQRSLA